MEELLLGDLGSSERSLDGILFSNKRNESLTHATTWLNLEILC